MMNQQIEKIGRFGIEFFSEVSMTAIITTTSIYGFLSLNGLPVIT